MSLRQYLEGVKERALRHMFQDFPPEQQGAIAEYAQASYRCCVTWFGPPLDPHKRYFIQQSVVGKSFCSRILGNYYLFISMEAYNPEQFCFHVAHEMYHRVTAGQGGFAGEMWVQEMLASLSSHWFLRRQGFTEYSEAIKRQWLDIPGEVDVPLMRASRRRKAWDLILKRGEPYSTEFVTSIGRIGYALIRLIDGSDLCRIIKAATLEEWIASLPQEKQYGVCRILEVASDGKKAPESAHDLYQLSNALGSKGDTALVIAELLEIARLQPENGAVFFHLGRAYQQAKDYQAARDACLTAVDLKFSDKWLPYNLATVYWYTEDYPSAATWYGEATRREPAWAAAYHYRGRALMKAGDWAGARAAWKKVLTLEDEQYAKLAQKALQENPLPDDAPE